MANSEIIQAMVMSFRLNELRALLSFAGKNKQGRKTQLQKRALDLLRLNSDDITLKIQELNSRLGRPLVLPEDNGSEDSSSARRTRSSRSRVCYVGPGGEDESSEILSDSSSEQINDGESYSPDGEGEREGGGDDIRGESEIDSDSDSSTISGSSSPSLSPQPSQNHIQPPPYNSPNILKKTNRKKTLSPQHNNEKQQQFQDKEPVSKHESHLLYPPCPDVQLIPLPFYKVEAVLHKPASLNPSNIARFQAQNFYFHLTPSQASAISASSYRDENGKLEYKNQILMRFCLNETSCPQDDAFPASICVIVNGRAQSLPNIIPTNKPGVEPKRPPKPINITGNCKLSATVTNYLNVTWTVEAGKGFCVAIYYVEKLTSNSLIKILKDKGNRHPAYTKAIIKDKLNDRDCEIATTSCKVTLACPLGKMRMSLPCRATTCDHLQCFDARLYIQMNERKPKWICPVCNKYALYENLMVDGYFMEVLNDSKMGFGENEIVLKNDATWEPLPVKTDDASSSKPPALPAPPPVAATVPNKNPSFETVDVVDDDEDDHHRSLKQTPTAVGKNSSEKVVECITLDDSDDDEPPSLSPEQPAKKLRIDNPTYQDFITKCIPQISQPKEAPALICLSEDED